MDRGVLDQRPLSDQGTAGDQGEGDSAVAGEMGAATDLGDPLDGSTRADARGEGEDEGPSPECIGPTPEGALRSDGPVAGEPVEDPTAVGSFPPAFRLEERQPRACGAGEHYGLDSFRGRPTFVALLSATCGYCLSQLGRLEQLRLELSLAGHELNWVLINYAPTELAVANYLERSSMFHILQDTIEINAWEALNGDKDDFYLYNEDGSLGAFLDDTAAQLESGTSWLYLSDPVGYENLRAAILEHLAAQPGRP